MLKIRLWLLKLLKGTPDERVEEMLRIEAARKPQYVYYTHNMIPICASVRIPNFDPINDPFGRNLEQVARKEICRKLCEELVDSVELKNDIAPMSMDNVFTGRIFVMGRQADVH